MKVHHVGYAVKDIEKAITVFETLGYKISSSVTNDTGRGVKIVFIRNNYETIELIAPNGENSAVDGILKKIGSTPYHLCYEVEDLEKSVNNLKMQGFIIAKMAQEAPALENRLVVFMLNKDIGIIELLEAKRN